MLKIPDLEHLLENRQCITSQLSIYALNEKSPKVFMPSDRELTDRGQDPLNTITH